MRVFISHSSRDKWAARTIEKELQEIGVDTFLDEKDIKSGDSIGDSIRENLRDCDHLMVLLSPASVSSHWVLVEVGGALALEKRVVPILFYLGANEIPAPLTKALARDINDISRYYDELVAEMGGKPAPPKTKRRAKKATEFAVGDTVRLPPIAQPNALREASGVNINWNKEMGPYVGKKTVVTAVDSDRSVQVEADGSEFWWAFEWLEKIAP